jgi:hypothetical protein
MGSSSFPPEVGEKVVDLGGSRVVRMVLIVKKDEETSPIYVGSFRAVGVGAQRTHWVRPTGSHRVRPTGSHRVRPTGSYRVRPTGSYRVRPTGLLREGRFADGPEYIR